MAAREICTCLVLCCAIFMPASAERPNIVVIIADDLGWNDVGFHGSNQIPTPNIDALAYSGLLLQNYYVTPVCTPSRAAFMTGKYPIHTGMQHHVLYAMETRGLPLSEKLLPQYLKELGYKTHLVGKWHLGLYTKEYLPLSRGFDSHLGFWTARIDMYDHTSVVDGSWGFDFRRGYAVADDLFGKYATDVYTDEAIKVINQHNQSTPLFLMIGHSAMHSGNPNEPIRAPDKLIDKFADIRDYQRRKYAAVLTKLDESVGSVMTALQKRGLLANSIVLFTTDNGGAAAGFNNNAASNWPLRGVKNTLWEGGIRGAGLLWSPLLRNQSRVATQSVQISDWLPTLLSAAGGNVSGLGAIDGFDQWQALSSDLPSPRDSIVHNIDDVWGSAALSAGKWKLVKGTNYNGSWDAWYGPAGRGGRYDAARVRASRAAAALAAVAHLPSTEHIERMREAATVTCDSNTPAIACEPLKSPCVFNLEEDPCERRNLADENPEMLQILLKMLQEANNTAVPPNNTPLDRRGDPKFWGRIYTNFGDYKTNSLSGNGVLS